MCALYRLYHNQGPEPLVEEKFPRPSGVSLSATSEDSQQEETQATSPFGSPLPEPRVVEIQERPSSPSPEERRIRREEFVQKYKARIVRKTQVTNNTQEDVLVVEGKLEWEQL